MLLKLLTIFVFLELALVLAASDKRVVCYYGTWAVYRHSKGKFEMEDIDPTLCTHAIYTFIGINEDANIRILDSYLDIDLEGYKRFNNLKIRNPDLKTIIAIGGWNEGSIKYSAMARNPELRRKFVQNVVDFLKEHKFDGFDMDWEYPGQRGGDPEDKENFVLLLKDLKEAFVEHGFILSAAVAAAAPSVDQSYDVPRVSKYLDIINVMAYDLHGPWDLATGANAPLYPASNEKTPEELELNVEACIKTWLERGAPPDKINLGIGTYGRTFTMANTDNPGFGVTAYSPGNPGPYSGESGMIGYNELCELQLSGQWTTKWHDEQQVPYSYSGNQFVGYDDPYSVSLKVAYALRQQLGGIMIWSVETDDFLGVCGPKYVILKTIRLALSNNGSTLPPPPSRPPVTTPTTKTTTETCETCTEPTIGPQFVCTQSGYFRDPLDCSKFYYCSFYDDKFLKYDFQCSEGLVYDEKRNTCDYKENVKC